MKDLKYELGGHFEDIVVALMMPAADYDATSLRKAIKVGAGWFLINLSGTSFLLFMQLHVLYIHLYSCIL